MKNSIIKYSFVSLIFLFSFNPAFAQMQFADSNIYISGIYSGWILGNLPTDGSKTGTITVNGSSIIYRASTYTEQDAGFSAGTSTSTSSSTTAGAAAAASSDPTVQPYIDKPLYK